MSEEKMWAEFEAFWLTPEQYELQMSRAKEWAFEVWKASRAEMQGEPVGEAGSLPGTKGFTMAVFESRKVPEGTKLYTAPQPAPDVAGLIVLLEQAQCPNCEESGRWHNDYGEPERCQWCHERSEALDAHRNGGGV